MRHEIGGYLFEMLSFTAIAFSTVFYSKYIKVFALVNLLLSAIASVLSAESLAPVFYYFFLVPSGIIVVRSLCSKRSR